MAQSPENRLRQAGVSNLNLIEGTVMGATTSVLAAAGTLRLFDATVGLNFPTVLAAAVGTYLFRSSVSATTLMFANAEGMRDLVRDANPRRESTSFETGLFLLHHIGRAGLAGFLAYNTFDGAAGILAGAAVATPHVVSTIRAARIR